MYVPAANAADDPVTILRLLRSAAVGHLISTDAEGHLDATLLPFLVDDDLTTLHAHFARANPQWRALDGMQALMIVPVTDAYVSPSWYPSKADDPRVVPTWNYEVVHVHGVVRVHDDAGFVEGVVRRLTDLHESERSVETLSPPRWSVDDAPADFTARRLRAIVGVELVVTDIQAKRKLSQNRSDADRAGVIDGLRLRRSVGDHDIADAMER
jgi:transcriptional regulator